MCADSQLDENEHSVLVASTGTSHVRLARNQAQRGYCLVILRDHVTDLADLDSAGLGGFWSDVQHSGRAIATVFASRKIDYLVMEHRMPHLHCHLLPQHHTDDPLRNINISDGPRFLPAETLAADIAAPQRAWMRAG